MSVTNGALSIYQDVEVSLTRQQIPPVIHVKQFDHMARKIRCAVYGGDTEYTIPPSAILTYSGARPDGRLFHYSSEALDNDKIALQDNRLIFTVTDYMTEVSGRYPVDVILLDEDGDVLSAFSLTLYVERSASGNGKIAAATYAAIIRAIGVGVYECFITEPGNFGVESDDGLDYKAGSESALVDRVCTEMVSSSIDEDGYFNFETDDRLGLVFSMDSDGHLIVDYGEED